MPVRVSVAMASYNGEKYIAQQIESIMCMMSDDDELVISDDYSTDSTWNIISAYAKHDNRIVLFKNNSIHGVQDNFNNSVMHARGQYILLSDQDDVWLNNKINRMVNIFETAQADCVIHNGFNTDVTLVPHEKDLFAELKITTNPIRNFLRSSFLGCCMGFTSKSRNFLCPFPANPVAHDIWCGVMLGIVGEIYLLDENLISHRLHWKNVSQPKSVYWKAANRTIMAKEIAYRLLSKDCKFINYI